MCVLIVFHWTLINNKKHFNEIFMHYNRESFSIAKWRMKKREKRRGREKRGENKAKI